MPKWLGFETRSERNKIIDDHSRILEGCGYVVKDIIDKDMFDNKRDRKILMIKEIIIPHWKDPTHQKHPRENVLCITIPLIYENLRDNSLKIEHYEIRSDENEMTGGEHTEAVMDEEIDDDDFSNIGWIIHQQSTFVIRHFELDEILFATREELISLENKIKRLCAKYNSKDELGNAVLDYESKHRSFSNYGNHR